MLPFYRAQFEWFADIRERYTEAELEALRVKDSRYAIAFARKELKTTTDKKTRDILKRALKRALSRQRRRRRAQ